MGLRLYDALRLSWRNIAQHKVRSAMIVMTVSILFSAVMAFNFVLDGLDKTVFDAAMKASNHKVYIATGYSEVSSSNQGEYYKVNNLDDAEKLIEESIRQHHGQVVGQIAQYNIGDSRWVINKELATRFSNLDFSKLKDNQVPYIGPKAEAESFGEYLMNADGSKDKLLAKVGTYPVTKPGGLFLSGNNPLNLLLSRLQVSGGYPLIVDDGSDKVIQYLQNQASYSSLNQEITPDIQQVVAEFDNYNDAIAYYWDIVSDNNILMDVETLNGRKYIMHSNEIFSNVIGAELSIRNLHNTLVIIEFLFITISVIVATLTFAHLADQDAVTISLYRSLGATTSSIYTVYMLYLFELCVLAALACIVVAFSLAGITWLTSAKELAQKLQDFYMLNNKPKITFFECNDLFFGIIGSIFAVVPLSMMLTLHHFSAKHIAKKLRAD